MSEAEGAQPSHKSYAAAAASGSAWTTAQTVVNKAITVIAMLLLARLLSPGEFGLANLAASIGAFAFVFAPFVMGDVLLSQQKRFDELAGTANAVAWLSAILLFALLSAAALPIQWFTGKEGLALLLVIAALRPVADAVLVIANTRMRIDLAYRRIAQIDGGVIFLATAASVVMAYFGAGPMAITLPPIATIAVRGVLYWRSTRGRIPTKINREFVRPIARRFAVAGLGQYLNNMLLSLELLLLGLMASDAEVGVFGLAFQLAMQANTVIAVQLGAVLQPIFAHIQNDPERQVGGFLRATRLLSSVAVPLSLMQAALAIPAFELLFQPKWTGSIAVFAVLSIGQTFVFVSAPSIALLKAQGRFRAYFAWQLSQLIAAVAVFYAAVRFGGDTALHVAQAIGMPTDPMAGKALALSFASATVWAISCPVAVWLAGRPARLSVARALGVFFEPWVVAVPVGAALVGSWLLLRGVATPWMANALAIGILGPIAVIVSIAGCVWMRADTRADFRSIIARFMRRKQANAVVNKP